MMMLSIPVRNLAGNTSSKFNKVALLKLRRRLSGSTANTNSLSSKKYNFDKFALLFQGCADVRFLKKIHANIFTHGFCWDVILGSKILSCYANLGAVHESRLVFQKIVNDDLSLWNSAMVDYFRAGYPEEVIILYKRLKLNRIGFDGKTITFALKSCTELKSLYLGNGVHADSLKLGLSGNKFVGSSFIGLYSKFNKMNDSHGVFKEIIGKDIVAYTSLITGYSEIVDSIAWNAFEIATDMLQDSDDILETSIGNLYTRYGAYQSAAAVLQNSKGTVASWNAMLSGLNRAGQSFKAIHIHAYFRRRFIPLDIVLATALIEVYSKCTRVMRSRHLFDQLIIKDAVSYNTMMYGYLQNGMADEATSLLSYMIAEGIAPDFATVLSLLAAFADQRDLVRGRWIHGFAIRHGFCSDVDVENQILYMYSVCGKIAAARAIFDSLENKNLVSWTAMMKGCLSNGHADEKDKITANSLISAYAKCGRLDLPVGLFFSLEYRNLDTWNAMISAYAMHGFHINVLEMFKQMEEENIQPDKLTFSTVLTACSHAGLVKNSWKYTTCTYYLHGPQNPGIYALISEVYAQEGQWNEFANTKASANLSGLKKHPGSSLIESMEQGMS
uniref:Pentacotripeptide-repeat region of PRORP domain-containing protein n=1 Tax=Oryza punctata TaxID=4537 RepID=A0A0E0JIB4_ORYPU